MFPSNPCFVLALLAVSSFGNFLVSVDGKCAIEPVDGHVNWPSKKKKIKKNAFKKCKELVTICIPPEVESIHNSAFVKSGLDLTKLYEVPCDAGPSSFSFKGPLQIERSVEGEPAAVLAAPPTDYFLQFTIELKSINDGWTSVITLTDDGYAYPDYLYGQWVPGVYIQYNTTQIVAYFGDDENGSNAFYQQPTLELNKKSTVLIKFYGTTATLSVNGGFETTQTVGPRSQLNDVSLYIGDPWTVPADAIVSDISFGLV